MKNLRWASYSTRAVVFCFLLLSTMITSTVAAGQRATGTHEWLAPEEGLWASFGIWQPYANRVAEMLLWEHSYRYCQIVFLRSFENESTVYVVREDDESVVVAKELRPQLWGSMMTVLEAKADAPEEHDARKERAALDQAATEVVRASTTINDTSFEILSELWQSMLAAPAGTRTYGIDGDSYHVAHFVEGSGYVSAQAYSPREGSVVHKFIQIGSALQALAHADAHEKNRIELELVADARSLLTQLEKRD